MRSALRVLARNCARHYSRPAAALVRRVAGSLLESNDAARRLQRLANVEANPHASLLADHYEDDWTRLWWVRVDGTARVTDDARALDLLQRRYTQYADNRPAGPVIALAVARISGWEAAS